MNQRGLGLDPMACSHFNPPACMELAVETGNDLTFNVCWLLCDLVSLHPQLLLLLHRSGGSGRRTVSLPVLFHGGTRARQQRCCDEDDVGELPVGPP